MNERTDAAAPQPAPADAVWPLLYEPEIRATVERLEQGLLTTVIRGSRGAGKTTILRELCRRKDGVFVQGRDPGTAGVLLEKARTERKNLFVDDLDYLLDPERERASEETGEATRDLEHKARLAIESLRQRGCAIVVAFMYPDRRFDVEYSGTISNLWQIGERQYLPAPWSRLWEQRLRELLLEPDGNPWGQSKDRPYSLFVGGTRVSIDERFSQVWGNEVVMQTGCHPTLVGAAMRALVADAVSEAEIDAERHAEPLPVSRKLASGELRTLVRQWLELTLTGEALNPVRVRLAALRSADRAAFEVLVRTAQSGGSLALSPAGAVPYRDILEHECVAYYDGRHGYLRVVGQAIRNEIVQAFGAASALLPDTEHPEDRGTLMVPSSAGPRPVLLSGHPWQVLKLLYERGGAAVSSTEIQSHINASTAGAVRAIIQRLSARLADAGLPGAIENRRRTGYYLIMSKLAR